MENSKESMSSSNKAAKKIVKKWEAQYFKIHEKKPDREALKQAPEDVKKAYKEYWKCKHKTSEFSKDKNVEQSQPLHESPTFNNSTEKNTKETLDQNSTKVNESSHPSVWGAHLNKKNKESSKENAPELSLYLKMAEKLRDNAIIKTRKSLKRKFRPIAKGGSSENKIIQNNTDDTISNTNGKCNESENNSIKSTSNEINDEPNYNSIKSTSNEINYEPNYNSSEIVSEQIFTNNFKCNISNNKSINTQSSQEINVNFLNSHNVNSKITKKYDDKWLQRVSTYDNPNESSCILSKADTQKGDQEIEIQMQNSINDYISDSDIILASDDEEPPSKKPKFSLCLSKSCSNDKNSFNVDSNNSCEENYLKNSQIKTTDNTIKDVIPDKITKSNLITKTLKNVKKTHSRRKKNKIMPEVEEIISQTEVVYNEIAEMENNKQLGKKSFKYLTKEEKLNKKLQSGKLNENYVKINIQKKVFVRGKKNFSSKNYKINEWKKKQALKENQEGNESSLRKFTCFRCGDFGHFASNCPGKFDSLLPVEDLESVDSFLTLEEAANLANTREIKSPLKENTLNDSVDLFEDEFENEPEDIDKNKSEDVNQFKAAVCPLYPSMNEIINDPTEVYEALQLFGYDKFLEGQEKTIMRILSGLSTLLILSTGAGKSLCYQLPAYLYAKKCNSITLCISPLVSLMEDQVKGLPRCVNAVCLHTQQNAKTKEKVLQSLKSGKVHILLVSPEAVASSHHGMLGTILKELPPVSFACIDEAHCISQWSHNFRPSYLQICKILKEKLNVRTILGLTATAKEDAALNIAKQIGIDDVENGIIKGFKVRHNLKLSVSCDRERDQALIEILEGKRFDNCRSIIVYCTRRDECERVATLLRTRFYNPAKDSSKSNKRGRTASNDAEAYHAGLTAHKRQQIQKQFMSGRLRIVVATVAFGMGIDKSDIHGIIHYNMSSNMESYVQEVGRAGRNGEEAHCHLFLDNQYGSDIQELKRHIFANSIDHFTLRKLLSKIFTPFKCLSTKCPPVLGEDGTPNNNKCSCDNIEIAIPVQPLIEELDLPEENIKTLLCYLELHPLNFIKIGHHVYNTCTIMCYKGPTQLRSISRKCSPLAVAVAFQQQNGISFDKKSSITFPVVEIASLVGWKSNELKNKLKKLEWEETFIRGERKFKKTGVTVQFSEVSFHVELLKSLNEEEQDNMLDFLYSRCVQQEKQELYQLEYVYKSLQSASHKSVMFCANEIDPEKDRKLKDFIQKYFSEGEPSGTPEKMLYIRQDLEEKIKKDTRALVMTHSDHSWNGRSVTRIFHGIQSPNFPAQVWGRVKNFWRLHLQTDFNLLLSIVTKELVKLK